jgi:hypothetical protein
MDDFDFFRKIINFYPPNRIDFVKYILYLLELIDIVTITTIPVKRKQQTITA